MMSSEGTAAPPPRHPVEHLAGLFAALLALGVRERAAYTDLLRVVLEANPTILSAWTIWEPGALDGRDHEFRGAPGHDESGRFMGCWHRAGAEPALDPVVGYEERGRGDWYWVPRQRALACAVEPIFYPLGEHWVWLTCQVAPVPGEGRPIALVGIDFPAGEGVAAACRRPECAAEVARIVPLRSDPLADLSAREREVLHWLRQGKTNPEIGIILGISAHTVKNHLSRIFQKLRVNNRYGAISPDDREALPIGAGAGFEDPCGP